jgi:hypothetical protein
MPKNIVHHKHPVENTHISARVVYAHPCPMAFVMGAMAADAPAPNSHRNRLFAAVAAADRFGHRSTKRAFNTCDAQLRPNEKRNRRITGPARLTLWFITHP